MLPLWIIDITTGESKRREAFQELLAKIEHVYIPEDIRKSLLEKQTKKDESGSLDKEEYNASSVNEENNKVPEYQSEETNESSKQTLEERLEEEEKRAAAKNAVIIGDYWAYSVFKNPFGSELTEEEKKKCDDFVNAQNIKREKESKDKLNQEEVDTYIHALKLYRLQEQMVKEGAAFIHRLRKANVKPYQAINIIVLGDVTQEFTRTVFPSVAAILQKEKGRYWTSHIHQGMTIWGSLFIPCNINTMHVDERKEILHMLDEIEVQHNITAIRGYDHMMLYQDVQNRTECAYQLLDDSQQAEYLVQCLVHMFLATNINHPVISGTASEDTFYFSMGAASVYFDLQVEDMNDIAFVAKSVLDNFKEDGEAEDANNFVPLIDKDVYGAEIFVKELNKIENLDLEDIKLPEFSPHPIVNYLHKSLKKLYYQVQLRYYPASILRSILTIIEEKTSDLLDKVSATSNAAYHHASMALYPAIVKRLAKVTQNDGALSFVEVLLRNIQELMSKERQRIPFVLETHFWDYIIHGPARLIPKNQKDYFDDYHDIYKSDVSSKNDGAGCANCRQEAMQNLKGLLSKEKTTLATLGRTFLMGIMCVLFFVPVLDFMSPIVINLGDVKKNSLFWGFAVFMIPVLIQYIAYLIYLRKRNMYIRRLKAYYTHDAYARIANRIEAEANEVYQKLTDLAGEYLERCKRIRKEVKFDFPIPEAKMIFPRSIFNQPLNGGTFNNEVVVPAEEVESSRIRLNFEPRPVNDLKRPEFFMLINYFNETLGMLFSGVSLTEKHARKFNDKLGDYEFISHDQLLREKEDAWVRSKHEFRRSMIEGIKKEMLPREYPTVGDKLIQYKKKIDRYTLLEPLMAFAATNGEITSVADIEYADIKVNREMDDLSAPYLPLYTTRTQVGKYDEIYQKYIFITRWRCFDHFSYNRILPTEDFDMDERAIVNYVEEEKVKTKKKREQQRQNTGGAVQEEIHETVLPYKACPSSLILWSVCPDENSGEWLKIFDPNHFGRAYEDREKYREVLNQND